MSGGIAYVLDEHQLFDTLCNLDMVDLEPSGGEKTRTSFARPHLPTLPVDRQPRWPNGSSTTGGTCRASS